MTEAMRTYAIGDIHGMMEPLERALGWIKEDAHGVKHRIVFLGDYVDRGPDSRGVLNLLRNGHPNWVILKGNHEDLMANAILRRADRDLWESNGGIQTLENYDTSSEEGRAALISDAKFIEKLPLSFDDGVRFFCHAGIDATRDLNDQDEHTLLWDREWFRNKFGMDTDVGRLVVHGHTPVKVGAVAYTNSLNLDTAAVFGYGLSIACWNDPKSRHCTIHRFSSEKIEI